LQTLNRELRTRVQQLDESRRVIELRTVELQKLSGSLLQIQDEERRRIARELHDDLAQHVTAVKMEIDASGRGKELSDSMGEILRKIRETSYLLHPPLLDEAGLRAALHWYVDGLMQRSKLQISLAFHPDILPGVPKEMEMTIFRIIQEALANVFRHSNSDSARVEVVGQAEQIIVRVRDFGKGISPRIAKMEGSAQMGVGISGMRERVRQMGGELSVTRAEPGTLVEATIPLNGVDVLRAGGLD
jgi:signal transduction histidine kinase